MNEHVSDDPLERLIAWFDGSESGESSEILQSSSGDPLERLDELILAARDLSADVGKAAIGGVLGELLKKIESARVLEPAGGLELRAVDPAEPRKTIAAWIRDESEVLGSMPAIQRVRASRVGGGSVAVTSDAEAAVGRVVLAMIGDAPLAANSRKKAVELLAKAMEQPSPQALQDILRILIAGE